MQLMPPIQEIEVHRGKMGTFTVMVHNDGDEDVSSSFSAHGLDMTIDGQTIIADTAYVHGCGNWITLEPEEFVIKAHETLTLKGKVTVPKNAEGGYYALVRGSFAGITIPLSAEAANIRGSQIALQSQAMVAVLLTIPSSRNRPQIAPDTLLIYPRGEDNESREPAEVDFARAGTGGWTVVMPLRNEGNIHARVSGRVSILSESGSLLESADFWAGRGYVLPGKVRNLRAHGKNALQDGYYLIRAQLQVSGSPIKSNCFPFAIYKGEVYPGAATEDLMKLLRATSPGFSLKRFFIQRTISPGGSSFITIPLVSTSDDTVILTPRKMDWSMGTSGQLTLGNSPDFQPRSCSPWIEFLEDTIIVVPKKNTALRLRAAIPKGIEGEYYSAIVFDHEEARSDLPVEFMLPRTQLLSLVTNKNAVSQIELDSVSVSKETTKDFTLHRFVFTVSNTGNIHCFVTGTLSLEEEASKGIYKPAGNPQNFGDRETYLLPGAVRKFEVDVPLIEPAQYRLILSVNYSEETQPVMRYQRIKIR
jgi:hypothetical protein